MAISPSALKFVNPKRGTEHAYNAGVEARDQDVPKVAPGGLGRERKSWWLAGYNDRDIELQVSANKKVEEWRESFPEIATAWNETSTQPGTKI